MAAEEEFYCMNEKKKVKCTDYERKTLNTKRGERHQLVGKCTSCGKNVYKFVK